MKPDHQPLKEQRPHWHLLLLILGILAISNTIYETLVQPTAVGQDSSTRLFDPLSASEYARGMEELDNINNDIQVEAANSKRQLVLLFERHHSPKQRGLIEQQHKPVARQGEGYIYNYDTNRLQRIIIDLTDNRPEMATPVLLETVQNVQLPLIAIEKEQALALLHADKDAWQSIQRQFRHITGDTLTSFSQLNTKVIIFRADAMPDQVNEASSRCGLHRCAQVLLYTHDQTVFEISPIVDLSSETVTQLTWKESHE